MSELHEMGQRRAQKPLGARGHKWGRAANEIMPFLPADLTLHSHTSQPAVSTAACPKPAPSAAVLCCLQHQHRHQDQHQHRHQHRHRRGRSPGAAGSAAALRTACLRHAGAAGPSQVAGRERGLRTENKIPHIPGCSEKWLQALCCLPVQSSRCAPFRRTENLPGDTWGLGDDFCSVSDAPSLPGAPGHAEQHPRMICCALRSPGKRRSKFSPAPARPQPLPAGRWNKSRTVSASLCSSPARAPGPLRMQRLPIHLCNRQQRWLHQLRPRRAGQSSPGLAGPSSSLAARWP